MAAVSTDIKPLRALYAEIAHMACSTSSNYLQLFENTICKISRGERGRRVKKAVQEYPYIITLTYTCKLCTCYNNSGQRQKR